MDQNDTLFSLELAVESLRVHSTTVVCRLPAVAFRLLDFPTLLLHHVDPEHAVGVREKITLDSFRDVPNQLAELKDHRGNFRINKCKSSLFKMSPQTLLGYLRNTPLYVMLIDVWPEVSKLVASCTVSLQKAVEEILRDIEENGADVPAVHGNRDSYKLYNLMGSEVGWIVVRYRLLSVGASLIPHIPQSAFAKRQQESVDLSVTPRKNQHGIMRDHKSVDEERDVVLEDLEVAGHPKTISVAVSTIDELNANSKATASPQNHQGTQTRKTCKQRTHRNKKFDNSIPIIHNDDLIINNTHCPPPLFFNTANEDASTARQYLSKDTGGVRNDLDVKTEEPISSPDLSEDLSLVSSRTLSEDLVHQIEARYTFPSEDQHAPSSPSWSVRKTHRTLRSEKSRVEKSRKHRTRQEELGERKLPQEAHPHGSDVCNRCQQQLDPNLQTQLPILAALLQELSLLHGNALQGQPPTSLKAPVRAHEPQPSTAPRSAKREVSVVRDGKENIHAQPQALDQVKPYRHKHRECAKPPAGVPATKGWLRQQQPVQIPTAKRRTKLQYGMTHSQKLRLRKNNPELLKEMEMEELRLRKCKEAEDRASMTKKHHPEDRDDFPDDYSKQNVSTEIAHHSDGEEQPLYSYPEQVKLPGDRQGKSATKKRKDASRSNHQRSELQSSVQPPVPVPRQDIAATFVWGDAAAHHLEVAAAAAAAAADNDQKASRGDLLERGAAAAGGHDSEHDGSRRESQGSMEAKDVSSSEKSGRSIDVYLPSASLNDSDDSTDTDSQFSSVSSFISRPKTIQVPGLPSEEENVSQKDPDRTEDKSYVEYSDDFVGSDKFASTGEQELEPLKSNRSSSDLSAESGMSEDSSMSEDSRSSSVRTTKSRPSQAAVPALTAPIPRTNGKPGNPQTRRLSIPKPQLSSISPVPVRRTSKTSTMSTAALTPEPPIDDGRSSTPPTPKPRPSLLRSASSFSETSLFRSTVPSSEFQTEDSQQAEHLTNKTESKDSYSDDFSNSEGVSDPNSTF